MRKRFSKSNLIRFLGHEATSEEVMHSHAYKKVEKQSGPSIRPKYPYSSHKKNVAKYRDSMVGSIAQYHDNTPIQTKRPEIEKEVTNNPDVVGNRPMSNADHASKKGPASSEQRHHFVEPPKRNFYRFD